MEWLYLGISSGLLNHHILAKAIGDYNGLARKEWLYKG